LFAVEGHWQEAPMLERVEKRFGVVRFGTEKNVGFPPLDAIFDSAATDASIVLASRGGGFFPRVQLELSRC
jgi:hypothetical protein